MALPRPDTIRINNAVYSWNSCSTFIANLPFEGITDISFDQGIERELVYTQTKAGAPIGRTEGKYTPTLKLTLLRDSFYSGLLLQLGILGLAQGGIGWGRVEFPVQLQYTHRQLGTHTIDFIGCAVAKQSDPNTQGTEAAKTELEISLMDIELDGYSMHEAGLL